MEQQSYKRISKDQLCDFVGQKIVLLAKVLQQKGQNLQVSLGQDNNIEVNGCSAQIQSPYVELVGFLVENALFQADKCIEVQDEQFGTYQTEDLNLYYEVIKQAQEHYPECL